MGLVGLLMLSAVSGSACMIWWTFTRVAFKVGRRVLAAGYLALFAATAFSFGVLFLRLIGYQVVVVQGLSQWILIILIGLPPYMELARR